jgi:subtilase family serine protease
MQRRVFLVAMLATTLFVLGSSTAGADNAPSAHKYKDVCAKTTRPDTAACSSKIVTKDDGATPLATSGPTGYAPADLRSAYKLPSSGSTATIAIVDAFDNPNAEQDMNAYRNAYGLGACTSDTGCFRKVNQNGGTTPPAGDVGWGQEIDLDIEMASAICPTCKILLVEGNSNSFGDLAAAVNRAAATSGVVAISNSYGSNGEFSGETSYSSAYTHPGIAVTASTGDSGYGTSFPAADNHVVAVGGTSLTRASSTARGWSESAWSGAGSGCSSIFAKPSWQTDTGCSRRMAADVSAVANPNTGVSVYDSYGSSGGLNWYVFGGTSVSAPIVASVYALANNYASVSSPASLLYSHTSSLYDVTSGSNGNCAHGRNRAAVTYFCNAVVGYDGPTGLGTPNGLGAF